ncbi:MAG: KH domain-containing protein [Deltaproteobacteria bacterium]|nr:KH domain-containing protein [Deltaproteobacteria bacterium]
MKNLVAFIARCLVRDPAAVEVSEVNDGRDRIIRLQVAEGDKGKVIGKEGRTAKAIRTVLAVASARQGARAKLDIAD